ncbi:hypothetical protein NC652_004759 [Populus alba x Populus x berolinensis]|nr:hypothetical protein NC652_004759 [Populus alba x Populus x berolinensis]
MGLHAMGSGHLALALRLTGLARGKPRTIWRMGDPTLVQGKPKRHLVLGQLKYTGQIPAPPGS